MFLVLEGNVLCPVLTILSSTDKRSLFTPRNFGLIKPSKHWFCLYIAIFDWYLIQLFVLLKPDFNWCNSFALLWHNQVTTRTEFVSAIANFVALFAVEITQSAA